MMTVTPALVALSECGMTALPTTLAARLYFLYEAMKGPVRYAPAGAKRMMRSMNSLAPLPMRRRLLGHAMYLIILR